MQYVMRMSALYIARYQLGQLLVQWRLQELRHGASGVASVHHTVHMTHWCNGNAQE